MPANNTRSLYLSPGRSPSGKIKSRAQAVPWPAFGVFVNQPLRMCFQNQFVAVSAATNTAPAVSIFVPASFEEEKQGQKLSQI